MRIAIAETLDPDGALARWASPDLVALGHEVLPLPTQELASVLGTRGLSAWILAVAEAFAPDLLMVCPPYDHALSETWAACRARGAKVVGFAMDEPLFMAARARAHERSRSLRRRRCRLRPPLRERARRRRRAHPSRAARALAALGA